MLIYLARALDDPPIYTSLYEPALTFEELQRLDVRTLGINKLGVLRRNHRLALFALAPAFSRLRVEADVVVCSSTGWAHGAQVEGRKLVYCNAPARWLYQRDRYLGGYQGPGGVAGRAALRAAYPFLYRWDQNAAATADRYIANSSSTANDIRRAYGIDAEIVHPPVAVQVEGEQAPVAGVEPGFLLCVSRLLPYKNIDCVVHAFFELPSQRLVVVGDGPEKARLDALKGDNVQLVGQVDDAQLRWLYANCAALVSASFEDFGLTPVEAAAFGKPTIALRYGGFLDTVAEGDTGLFFEELDPSLIATAIRRATERSWDEDLIRNHANLFSESRFIDRIRALIDTELGATQTMV
jgi:glycosyltransferase involved in cell wall biosynthesis